MSDKEIKSKFDQFIENLKEKYWLPILVATFVLFLLSLLANIFQLVDSASFTSIIRRINETLGSYTFNIPTFVILFICLSLGFFWLKERSLRKHLETDPNSLNQKFLTMTEEIKKLIKISNQRLIENSSVNNLDTIGGFYSKFQDLLVNSKNSLICVCGVNREWAYKLVFSVFISKIANNIIIILCSPEEMKQKRFKLLSSLGCELISMNENYFADNFRGVIVNPHDKSDCHAILIHKDSQPIYGNYYFGPFDFHAINLFFRGIDELGNISNLMSTYRLGNFTPTLKTETEESVIERMPSISFYRNAGFEFRNISVNDAIPVSGFVEEFKYNQIKELFETYKKQHSNLFVPLAITLKDNYQSTVLPPVLEEKEGKLFVAEGHTRLYYHWVSNPDIPIRVIIVKGVDKGFTKEPTTWDNIGIKLDKDPLGENAKPLARNIEGQFRDEILDKL